MAETILGHDGWLALTYIERDAWTAGILVNRYMQAAVTKSSYLPTEQEMDLFLRAKSWAQNDKPYLPIEVADITKPNGEEIQTLWNLLLEYTQYQSETNPLVSNRLGIPPESFGRMMRVIASCMGQAIALDNDQEVKV